MAAIKLGILIEDKTFASAVCETLGSISGVFRIYLPEFNPEAFQKFKDMDIILMDEGGSGLYDRLMSVQTTGSAVAASKVNLIKHKCLIMTEEPPYKDVFSWMFSGDFTGSPEIYKYGNATDLAKGLKYFYNRLTGESGGVLDQTKCKFIGIVSAKGGTGKTTLALALGEELTRYRGRKVLYISMEELESVSLFLGFQDRGQDGETNSRTPDLKQYLYYFLKEKEPPDPAPFLQHTPYGVAYFKPSEGRNCLLDLSEAQLLRFLGYLGNYGGFDVIFLDTGYCLQDKVLCILNECHEICIVSLGEEDKPLTHKLIKNLLFHLGEDRRAHMVLAVRDETSEFRVDVDRILVYTDRESVYFKGDKIYISIDGAFGESISHLSARLV